MAAYSLYIPYVHISPSPNSFSLRTRAHRYPREDEKLVAAVTAVSTSLVLGWQHCWAQLLPAAAQCTSAGTPPRSAAEEEAAFPHVVVAWAAERFLEAYWWLLHRLSAFRVLPLLPQSLGGARAVAACMARCGFGAQRLAPSRRAPVPPPLSVPLPLDEAGQVSRCALWLGLLPAAALCASLRGGEPHTLLYVCLCSVCVISFTTLSHSPAHSMY